VIWKALFRFQTATWCGLPKDKRCQKDQQDRRDHLRTSTEVVERVIRVLQERRHSPVEVQARAVIAAVQGIDSGPSGSPTESEIASRRATTDAELPDFTRVVEEQGILKPKP
jgi:hypothetical protein